MSQGDRLQPIHRPATGASWSSAPILSVRQRREACHELTIAYVNTPRDPAVPEEHRVVLIHFSDCFHFAFNSAGIRNRWLEELRPADLGGFGLYSGSNTPYKLLMLGEGANYEDYSASAEGPEPFEELDHYKVSWDDHGSLDVLCRGVEVIERVVPQYSRQAVLELIEAEFPVEPNRYLG